jgi:hypothetical protein
MRRLLLLAALAGAVLVPGAGAGGWATVQLSAVPTDGTRAGTTLPIDITVLQHGRTPLAGVTPVFRLRDEDGRLLAAYRGTPTGRTGVYHVDVRLPAGVIRYEVDDGFTQYGNATTHTYAPVRIEGPAGGSFPTVPVVLAAVLALALAATAALVLVRRSRSAPRGVIAENL